MKKLILFSCCFLFVSCSNQIKLNKSRDVDIILTQGYFSIGATQATKFHIKNNSDKTYIIDPRGFYGKSIEIEDGRVMQPSMYFKNGYYSREIDPQLCMEDLIILLPKTSIDTVLNLNSNRREVYNYLAGKKYFEIIKSTHTKYNATMLGCGNYVRQLESKGYKVLDDSISAKIPLFP